ncbi:hypothetical protein OOT00_08280 [Desulfobotulus sp. H1]|uniref:histidine kinase n=1 Tax=Desulfobotulus pelophilus TaxID=2823377 RepID=A0ABT3N947_9BACT|nr:hypothetical protein [Desulfobotulus pelophilus]MCW7753981.1 hypothetical protein [Desulfobotulus pelophilus]
MDDFQGIQFSGKITAALTHELRNVLAVIRETGGLMQDVMALTASSGHGDERIRKGFQTIGEQVLRGSELMDRLNRFAHTPDRPEEFFDMAEAAKEFFLLTERFCRLKRIEILPETEALSIYFTASRFYFFVALFTALEMCLSLPEGSRIPVSFSRDRGVLFHGDMVSDGICMELAGGFFVKGDSDGVRVLSGAMVQNVS